MRNQFISYTIAKELKELGFNEECLVEYENYDDKGIRLYPIVNFHTVSGIKPSDLKKAVLAPLWQQVICFLRETYGFHIEIPYKSIDDPNLGIIGAYGYYILDEPRNKTYHIDYHPDLYTAKKYILNIGFETYYQAREQAILKAIEIIKNK